MAEKIYRVQFTAHLHKLSLALKMQCEIQVIWKRGEKVCESGKVSLINGQANFDRKITISCNMSFNTKTKIFKQKITKFSIILTSEKGVKQAGDISFDVAQYINQKQLNKKDYQQKLSGCPDKNAKLTFTLTGVLKQQLSLDAISQSSYINNQTSQKVQSKPSQPSPFIKQQLKNSNQAPTQDRQKPPERGERTEVKGDRLKLVQQQNRKIKQQLKGIQKLKQENEQLRKKMKAEDYKKAAEIKQKIEKYKKQIEKMKSEIRANKKIQDDNLQIEKDIFKCKVKIMKAFNFASEFGGSKLVDAIQQNCGYGQK